MPGGGEAPAVRDLRWALLRAALLDEARARAAWSEARPMLGPPAERTPEVGWLLSLVLRNLAPLDLAPELPRLKGVRKRSWYVNQLKRRQLSEIVRGLGERGVAVLLLGGLPLAFRYYGDSGLRPVRRLELMVREDDVPPAVRLLESRGWRFHGRARLPRLRPLYRRWEFADLESGSLVLHRGGERDDAFGSAVEWALDGVPVRVPVPEAQFLDVIRRDRRLPAAAEARTVVDAVMVLRATGDRMDWARVADGARRRALVPSLEAFLVLLAHRLDASVPGPALESLAGRPRTSVRLPPPGAPAIPGDPTGTFDALRRHWASTRGEAKAPRRAAELILCLRDFWGLRGVRELPGEALRRSARRWRLHGRARWRFRRDARGRLRRGGLAGPPRPPGSGRPRNEVA